jgi:uncharacterized membrane protein YfcA
MAIEQFNPKEAIPITMSLIFVCSLATFYTGVIDKQKNPQNNFVDYEIALICLPNLLLGAKFGAIFNKILPKFIVGTILMWFIINVLNKIYQNAIKQRAKESETLPSNKIPVILINLAE